MIPKYPTKLLPTGRTGYDLTGLKFNRLTTLYEAASRKDASGHVRRYWHCRCDCGNELDVMQHMLIAGEVKSCGCLHREVSSEIAKRHNASASHHWKERLYCVWRSMIERCYLQTCKGYPRYGGRGIRVCESWRNYFSFRDWAMSSGYDPEAKFGKCTLERNDINGDYCPENCCWKTMLEQGQNRSTNIFYEYSGEKLTLRQLSIKYNLPYSRLKNRIRCGFSIKEAMEVPLYMSRKYYHKLVELGEIQENTDHDRYKQLRLDQMYKQIERTSNQQ